MASSSSIINIRALISPPTLKYTTGQLKTQKEKVTSRQFKPSVKVTQLLLDLDHSASSFKFAFGICSRFLAHVFKHFGTGSLSNILCLFQTQVGPLADYFDPLNLLCSGILDDHIEFGL